jgi:hypothetical protein
VAYDDDLAERIRELLVDEPGVTETNANQNGAD